MLEYHFMQQRTLLPLKHKRTYTGIRHTGMVYTSIICLLICPIINLPVSLFADMPKPGMQVVQSIVLPASTSTWKKDEDIGIPRPLDVSKTETIYYWLFLPLNYETQSQSGGVPLLLFLHGRGEWGDADGTEIAKVKMHGPPRRLEEPEFAKDFPCITVSPQCKTGFAWSPDQMMLLLDHIEQHYKIDKNRVYITGLSMGGFGTWMCLNNSPNRFAAAAPICGGADVEWAKNLTHIPIWTFHGDQDQIVKVDQSQRIVDAIRKTGSRKVLLTIYKGEGHDSWTRTYDNQLLFDWLFQQSLARPSDTAPSDAAASTPDVR